MKRRKTAGTAELKPHPPAEKLIALGEEAPDFAADDSTAIFAQDEYSADDTPQDWPEGAAEVTRWMDEHRGSGDDDSTE